MPSIASYRSSLRATVCATLGYSCTPWVQLYEYRQYRWQG